MDNKNNKNSLKSDDLESTIDQLKDTINFAEKSEMGQIFDNLDNDRIDKSTNMSSVDFNSRLTQSEIASSMVIDELTRLGILPDDSGITRQKKRLSVSLMGKGREEKVRMIAGEREHRTGISGKLQGMFEKRP